MSNSFSSIESRLEFPTGRLRVVIDTDPYNEIDDQFAIAQMLFHPERFDVEAIHAAPFVGHFGKTPGEGMEASYVEIQRVLDVMSLDERPTVCRGSTEYLSTSGEPQRSAATDDLIERAFASDDMLYVVAIAAPTNIANALRLDPRLADRICVVWLGGHAFDYWEHDEFNLKQDPVASRTLVDSQVPLTIVPCGGVASALATSIPEIRHYLEGTTPIGDYLASIAARCPWIGFAERKVIWDIAAVAWLLNEDMTRSEITSAPILADDLSWQRDESRHPIRYVYYLQRDLIFKDVFTKLMNTPE